MTTERSKRSPPVRIEPTSSAFQAAVLAPIRERSVCALCVSPSYVRREALPT